METLLFTKHLQKVGDLDIEAAADAIAGWGFDGADLTVREGGYVEPSAVESALPDAVETFRDRGLSVPMITTGIRTDGEQSARIFETAEDCGVDVLKTGYWGYDGLGTLEAGLEEMTAGLREIGSLAQGYDVTPAMHVHSGPTLSASGPILADVIADVDGVAAYPDLGHLALEGARDGWKMSLERLLPHAAMLGVKDYGWERGEDGWTPVSAPLGDGLVDWDAALAFVAESEFDGPISYHAEFDVPYHELHEQIGADFAYLEDRLP